MNTVTELLQPVENDLDDLILELKNLIGAGHPILQAAAEHLFSAGGKRLRPVLRRTGLMASIIRHFFCSLFFPPYIPILVFKETKE